MCESGFFRDYISLLYVPVHISYDVKHLFEIKFSCFECKHETTWHLMRVGHVQSLSFIIRFE